MNAKTVPLYLQSANFYVMLYLIIIFLSLIALIFLIVFLARAFVHWRSNIPIGLYVKALRDENSGHFEEAIITYEIALVQCNRIRFQRAFKNKIIGKLKLLHAIIDYKNSSRFVR
ncbi:MAG: hypothetical protein J0H74_03840 [Chitinophagaceae bacterium]|nr:hypothetical protein [Chitinophagaceae bacterium]